MKKLLLIFLLLSFLFSGKAQIDPSQINSDIDQLKQLIESKHVRPFWITSEEDFEKQIQSSKDIISEKKVCDESCYVELFKIISSIRDGHSSISAGSRYELFGYLPITTKWFDGNLHILKTSEEYKEILGHRITMVNGVGIEEVLLKLKSVVPSANESRFKKFVGSYLHLPGLLYGLGITDDPKSAVITFSNGNKSFDLVIKDLPPEEEDNTVFVSFLVDKKELPLYQQNNNLHYWFDYDEKNELIYFQYNRIGNMESESSSQFSQRLWATVDSVEVSKFVLDLRYNGGGSFPYSLKFIQGILDRVDLSRRGTLFIVTGYETFSAAILMLNQLELRSQAIIVGELPCDYPASPGDSESFTLNNSQIKVNLSALFHPTIFKNDKRAYHLLDREIITEWKDYETGIDPVMTYLLNFSENKKVLQADNGFEKYLGRYEYSSTHHIQLRNINNELWMEIKNSLISPLYVMEESKFTTEINGLSISLKENLIEIFFPDGTTEKFEKLDNSSISAMEYIHQGEFEKAEKIFLRLKENNPDLIEIKDHQMSFLASIVFFELKKYPDVDASNIARNILNLGIKLNEGNAPFCEFSLRFY